MTIFNVASSAELSAALASAAGGDRIVVADGSYGRVSIANRSFDSTVTITAANPGAGAHFDGLTITGSKNVSLVGLDLGRALNAGEAYYTQLNAISGSTNISLDRVTIHGSQDGDPTNDGMGLMLRNNAGFSITNSTFTDLHRGIVAQSSTNTTIQDNSITRIQSDGIISIANDGLSIQGNHLGDFRPVLGDHADAIQFWNTGQTKGQSNITIKDNVIFQTYFSGVEGTGIQGIFISDPLSYGYQNVLIQNNAIYANDAYHGIFVNGATGVQILDNTVTSNPNDSKMFWIFATNSSDVAIQNNVTDRITAVNVTNLFQDGNLDFQVNPAARADLPSLASPSDAHDLITAGAGYQLRGDAPDSPVSSAVGTAIGDMLARVGGSSAGHKVVGESSTLLHDAASTASPELDLGGLKAIVGDAQPAAPVQHHFAHEVAIQPTVREMMGHLFLDHFVALP